MLNVLANLIFGANANRVAGANKRPLNSREQTLRFDSSLRDLKLANGEVLIGCFYPIEDIKGNPEHLGVLKVTNVRLIWQRCDKRRVNLSIGFKTVLLAFQQNVRTPLGSPSTSLCVLTNFENTRYEFIFRRMWTDNTFEGPFYMADLVMSAVTDVDPSNQTSLINVNDVEFSDHIRQDNLTNQSHEQNSNDFSYLGDILEANSVLQGINLLIENRRYLQVTHLSPYDDGVFDSFEVVFRVWQAYKQTLSLREFRHASSENDSYLSLQSVDDIKLSKESKRTKLVGGTNDIGAKDPLELPFEVFEFERVLLRCQNLICVNKSSSTPLKAIGDFFVTNVRLIWLSIKSSSDVTQPIPDSMSIPLLKIESIKYKRDNKVTISIIDTSTNSTPTVINLEFKMQSYVRGTLTTRIRDEFVELKELLNELIEQTDKNPKIGPELNKECIEYMKALIPIDFYAKRTILAHRQNKSLHNEEQLGNATKFAGKIKQSHLFEPRDEKNLKVGLDDEENEEYEDDVKLNNRQNEIKSRANQYSRAFASNNVTDANMPCLKVIYSEELGLTVEKPQGDQTVSNLWLVTC